MITRRLAYSVNLERIFNVVERTVRGLFFHEKKFPLPRDHTVMVQSNDSLRDSDPDFLAELGALILNPLRQIPARVIQEDVFFYRYAVPEEREPGTSVWMLTFFRDHNFLVFTAPASGPTLPTNPPLVHRV